jgi:hypothetical protein
MKSDGLGGNEMNSPATGDGDLDDLIFQDAWQISDR